MRKYVSHIGILIILLAAGCQVDNATIPVPGTESGVYVLEEELTNYQLEASIEILPDMETGYSIEDIVQPAQETQFLPYSEYPSPLKNHQYYWGKIQIENRLTEAEKYTEWVLIFTERWTDLDVFTKDENGSWQRQRSGDFTPDRLKDFVPTASDNPVKVILPPQETVTIYFRGIGQQTAIYPHFTTRLKHLETYYDELLQTKAADAIFIGFLLMMFFYNLVLFFFDRDRSFLFYSGYLLMVVIYSAYTSEDLADWFHLFPEHPQFQGFIKLSLFLAIMFYVAFIRSFLDLEHLLPKWDTVFKFFVYLGFPLIAISVVISLTTNFSYVVEDRVLVSYIIFMILMCCSLLYPLYKTRDKKGYFIIAGIATICLASIITVISRVWLPSFTIFYLKAGTLIEVLIFSVGLAYRQRVQKQARQLADFKLKESRLIQEKKQMETNRLQDLHDFKARFYTNITHEFRTPLTVIMGMTENIKKHDKEKQLIQRNSRNLLRKINQLLDLSKLESGSLPLHQVHQDIIVYLQYLTESFYSNATQKNIRLVFHSEEKQVMMDYDEEKIQQVVYNLLSNALKFTSSGGQIIFHASTLDQDDRPYLKLKVKDSGIGIPPENIDHIFDRFYQVDQAVNGKEGSTGIGLALTKELIELMNGRIEVESTEGKGTEFTAYLPITATAVVTTSTAATKAAGERQTPQPIAPGIPSEADDHSETSPLADLPELLIIEDNRDIITYIKTVVRHKYKIHTAGNGALGIEKALEIIPDIIISDVMMPEKSGYEVCERLKQDERTSHIPIILLTAKATQSDKVDGLKYGADAYLTKPFDKEELIIRLEKLVEMRRLLQQRYAEHAPASELKEPSVDDIFLQKLREHLQLHLSEAEFGVTQLAEAVPMSQMQLYRKLKALTGKTPSLFIRSFRLQKGLELLQKEELNISEIAYEVGFTDPSYFSRVFHKEFGKSPSDYVYGRR